MTARAKAEIAQQTITLSLLPALKPTSMEVDRRQPSPRQKTSGRGCLGVRVGCMEGAKNRGVASASRLREFRIGGRKKLAGQRRMASPGSRRKGGYAASRVPAALTPRGFRWTWEVASPLRARRAPFSFLTCFPFFGGLDALVFGALRV